MNDEQHLAAEFERVRPRMVRIAYAILGSHAEAEDAVADCSLKLIEADAREAVRDVEGWATVAVARRALDVLRSARVRREAYPGPWLPEPIVSAHAGALDGPEDRVTLDETVSYALLVVLERLSPAERTAWVLHEVFGFPFPEIATLVGRSPAAVRQSASRARQHLAEATPRFDVDRPSHDAALERFLIAAAGGDLAALVATLDPDVVLTSDGGGQVSAALRPVEGAEKVARFLHGLGSKLTASDRIAVIDVNGLPALGVYTDEVLSSVIVLTVAGEQISRIDVIRSPAKLGSVT